MTEEKQTTTIDGHSVDEPGAGVGARGDMVPPRSWLWVATSGGAALALAVALLALLWFMQRPLALLFLALAVAAALAPAARWVSNWLPRTMAVVATYLILALVLVLLGLIVVPTLVTQAGVMAERVPELADDAMRWLEGQSALGGEGVLDSLASQVAGLGSALVEVPLAISSSLLDVLLVIFLSLYGLLAAPDAHQVLLSVLPADQEERVNSALGSVARAMGGYVRGAGITGVIIGTITYVGLLVIGVSFPLVLAIVAGVLEFIPFVGPFVAGAVIVLVAFLQSPAKALIALPFVIGLQQVEGNLISPNVMHGQICLSPLTTLFAIFTGWTVAGVLGALIAVPLAAVLRALIVELVLPALQRRAGTDSDEADSTC